MTMTTSQETISDTARRDGEALSHAMHDWIDSIQKFVGSEPTLDARAHSASHVVDSYFHVLEQILAIQRDVAKSFLAVTLSARKAAQDMTPKNN
jgi:hypothetical protein